MSPMQPLVKVSSRTFVTIRPRSTQRTAGHAEAEKKEIRADRASSPKRRRHEDGDDRAPGISWYQEFLGERGQAKMTT
eukprot:4272037-Pleurochrysis_carterae.AAC.1